MYREESNKSRYIAFLVGAAGFEPTRDRVKVCCLTAWLYPNTIILYQKKENKSIENKLFFVLI